MSSLRKERAFGTANIYDNYEYIKPEPNWPIGGREHGWLYAKDITNVMKQCAKFDKSFYYLGTELMDFWYFRPAKYYNSDKTFVTLKNIGKTKFAMILNLYGERAEYQYKHHWVCIYIDMVAGTIEYFDAMLFNYTTAVNHIIMKLALELSLIYKAGEDIKIRFSNSELQKNKGECGIYAIDYICSRIAGKTMDDYYNEPHDIAELRNKYFKIE